MAGRFHTAAPRRRGRPLDRETGFGVLMDYGELRHLLKGETLSPRGSESLDHIRSVIRAVWARARFLSCEEWQRSGATNLAEFFGGRGDGGPLPTPPGGWRTCLPDDRELNAWIRELAPKNLGASRRKLLALRLVGYRWRLSPGATYHKIFAVGDDQYVWGHLRERSNGRRKKPPKRKKSQEPKTGW